MEEFKIVVSALVVFFCFYVGFIWMTTRLAKARKEREAKKKAEILDEELRELAKWGVRGDEVYVIKGRLTMSIHAMITLANNPDYLAHLRKEAKESRLNEDFFEVQLLKRIEKAKQRIQDRVDRMRVDGKPFIIDNRLKDLGIK